MAGCSPTHAKSIARSPQSPPHAKHPPTPRRPRCPRSRCISVRRPPSRVQHRHTGRRHRHSRARIRRPVRPRSVRREVCGALSARMTAAAGWAPEAHCSVSTDATARNCSPRLSCTTERVLDADDQLCRRWIGTPAPDSFRNPATYFKEPGGGPSTCACGWCDVPASRSFVPGHDQRRSMPASASSGAEPSDSSTDSTPRTRPERSPPA